MGDLIDSVHTGSPSTRRAAGGDGGWLAVTRAPQYFTRGEWDPASAGGVEYPTDGMAFIVWRRGFAEGLPAGFDAAAEIERLRGELDRPLVEGTHMFRGADWRRLDQEGTGEGHWAGMVRSGLVQSMRRYLRNTLEELSRKQNGPARVEAAKATLRDDPWGAPHGWSFASYDCAAKCCLSDALEWASARPEVRAGWLRTVEELCA